MLALTGIVGSSGPLWKEHRTFALKTLRDFGFGKRNLQTKIHEQVEVFLSNITEKKGEAFDVKPLLKMSIASVIASISMSITVDKDSDRLLAFMSIIDTFVTDPNIRNFSSFLPFTEYIPGDPFGTKKRNDLFKSLHKYMSEVTEEHKRSYDPDDIRDYVDAYIKEQNNQCDDKTSTFTSKHFYDSYWVYIKTHNSTYSDSL